MALTLYLAYLAVSAAMALTPGPAVLLVTSQAMARGAGAGVLAALGVQTANAIYWLVFSLGLGAVIAASTGFFLAVKYAGAAYLVVLGLLTIRNAGKLASAAAGDARTEAGPIWRAPFAQGLANQLANPKALLFIGVLAPQFVTPGKTTGYDLLILASTGMSVDFIALCFYAWIAARTGALFSNPARLVWRERAAGAAQIAVGGLLATLRRAA